MIGRLIRVRCEVCTTEHEVWVWSEEGEGDVEAQVVSPCECQHDAPDSDRETKEQALRAAAAR